MAVVVGVAVDQANALFDKIYSYSVPQRLEPGVAVGAIVLVPFGRTSVARMGVVLSVSRADEPENCKPILDCAPEQAVLSDDLLQLVAFVRERTFCTYYDAVKAVVPFGAQYRVVNENGIATLKKGIHSNYVEMAKLLVTQAEGSEKLTRTQLSAIQLLSGGPLSVRQLKQNGISRDVLKRLQAKNRISLYQEEAFELSSGESVTLREPLKLSEEQQQAFDALASHINSGAFHSALLHGVTGSGKTVVFIRLIQQAIACGKQALVLVPEIGLTPQMISRLKGAFGNRVAVQHSALSNTERLVQWRAIQAGKADIVVGTRSAIFAPLSNIGLIILDEEQERTYYSDSSPRYSAHDVARMRAKQNNALLLFASATPSIETYFAAEQNRCQLVKLTGRYSGNPLPTVQLIDTRNELMEGNRHSIGFALADQMKKTLDAHKQVILLLNRRGYHTVAKCEACGKSLKCSYCAVPLVYHKPQNRLMCHYCGRITQPAPNMCPECGGKLIYSGYGTQRIEEELHEVFPTARVLRMDQDTTEQKGAHQRNLQQFANHEYDILVGTQMVAKGLDFPNVVLVGVLGIDALLNGQNFRSFEYAFSMITQVVGRSGRADVPGRAVIQTNFPDHPILKLACLQDYEAFYRQEICFRKVGLYPPYCSVLTVGFSGSDEVRTLKAAIAFSDELVKHARSAPGIPVRVLGPAPMNISYVNGHYRYKLTIKCRNDISFRNLVRDSIAGYSVQKGFSGVSLSFDFNSDGD